MKKCLVKIKVKGIFYYKDGEKIFGCPSDLRGNVSELRGNVSGIWGEVSDLRGDVSGIRGNVSGLRGDVDDCKITDEERENGVDIKELIK
jgi:hypothetical protein